MHNILIIDSFIIAREHLKQALEKQDMNIFKADDSTTVKNETFASNKSITDMDLILLEIQLKNDDGWELLSYLTDNFPDIPVLILSIDNKKSSILQACRQGAKDYILKPFDKQVMIDKINEHINIEVKSTTPKDKNTTQKHENTPESEFDYFKVKLLEEINRSLRSNCSFSVVRLNVVDHNISNNQNFILNLIRSIDQLYMLDEHEFILLLPLTNNKGAKTVLQRLGDEYHKEYNKTLHVKNVKSIITFPEDIVEEIDCQKAVSYQDEILNRL